MKKLVFATNNLHKVEEVQLVLGNQFKLLSLLDIGFDEDIEETGATLRENALIKAKTVFDFCKKPTFSDDSGLVVPALNGEPGVHSAHYTGTRDSHANNLFLIEKLKGIEDRNAYFACILCFLDEKENTNYFEGKVEGKITKEFSGIKGFGYDPIFVPNGFDKSFAEMEIEQKNLLSHRAKAIHIMVEYLMQQL